MAISLALQHKKVPPRSSRPGDASKSRKEILRFIPFFNHLRDRKTVAGPDAAEISPFEANP